jgi:hypothetical protein
MRAATVWGVLVVMVALDGDLLTRFPVSLAGPAAATLPA